MAHRFALLRGFQKLRYLIVLPAVLAVALLVGIAIPLATYSRYAEEIDLLSTISHELAVSTTGAWNLSSAIVDPGAVASTAQTCPILYGQDLQSQMDEDGREVSFTRLSSSEISQDVVFSLDDGVFEYHEAVRVDEACLTCHDSTSVADSFTDGQVVGALNISLPSEKYDRAATFNTIYDIVVTSSLAVVCIICIWIPLRRFVTKPIERLEAATKVIEQGEYGTRVDPQDINARGEIMALVENFNKMVDSVQRSYSSIEEEVRDRTQDLREVNERLSQHQQEIEALNEQLVKESNYKSKFLAVMSHELKTPLTAIMANIDLLEHENDLTKRAILVNSIDNSAEMLLRLISQILDAARLESGKMQMDFEAVDIDDIVNAADTSFRQIAAGKGVYYESRVADTPILYADVDKVLKITTNLVSNAIKFTGPGGRVVLDISYDDQDELLIVSVSDTGIGISQGEEDLLFERFYQSDQTASRSYGGAGLGLSIVKEFAQMHGGRVYAQSLEKGSRFTAEIKARPWKKED